MKGRATVWILPLLLTTLLTRVNAEEGESSQTPGEPLTSERQPEKQKRLSPLRVRSLVKPLSQKQLGLFYDLYARTYFGGDLGKQERLAFIVEDAAGEWRLLLVPSTGDSSRERYKGAVPAGTVGIVHTHPRGEEGFNVSRQDKKATGVYKDPTGSLVRVNWNYILHVNGILAVDARGNEHVVATRGWLSSVRPDLATSVMEWVPPMR